MSVRAGAATRTGYRDDGYDGTVAFYVIEPDDPIVRVYRDASPALSKI